MTHPEEKLPKRAGVWNIRDFVVKKIGPIVDEYAEWYAEHGISLPAAYEFDPTGWTETLRHIQRAFNLAAVEKEDYGEFFDAKNNPDPVRREELLTSLREEISTGFRLFGKHLDVLYDKYHGTE